MSSHLLLQRLRSTESWGRAAALISESPSLGTFQTRVDAALVTQLEQGLGRVISRGPSNPKHSVILSLSPTPQS